MTTDPGRALADRYKVVAPTIVPGSRWVSQEDGRVIVVESFDGAYAVVTNVGDARYPQGLVQWGWFGMRWQPEEQP